MATESSRSNSSSSRLLLPRHNQQESRSSSSRFGNLLRFPYGLSWSKAGGLLFLFLLPLLLVFLAFAVLRRPAPHKMIRSNDDGAISDLQSLHFLVVGDWGREGRYNQTEVAVQMGIVGQDLGIEHVVSVGDNFYETGLTGVDDPAFTASFTNVYTAPSLQTTWYTVLGNHDYMGDVLAQLSHDLVRRDWRWFCRRAFQISSPLCRGSAQEDCNASVDMFFIDTTPFVNEYWENTTQSFDWRGLAPRPKQLQLQLEDLEMNLRKSNATWKIVFGHHPIRTVGHHGDTLELVDQLLPILEKYNVDLYINGHDHNVQHIKRVDSPIHFITSGGGSKAYNGLQPYGDDAGVQFVFDGQGFLAVSMTENVVALKFYDVVGAVLHSFALRK